MNKKHSDIKLCSFFVSVKRETSNFHMLTLHILRTALGLLHPVFKDYTTLVRCCHEVSLECPCVKEKDWSSSIFCQDWKQCSQLAVRHERECVGGPSVAGSPCWTLWIGWSDCNERSTYWIIWPKSLSTVPGSTGLRINMYIFVLDCQLLSKWLLSNGVTQLLSYLKCRLGLESCWESCWEPLKATWEWGSARGSEYLTVLIYF